MKKPNNFFRELTLEKVKELRQKRIKKNKSQSFEAQLGFYVGEYIVTNYLPTLSTNRIRTRTCIMVSDNDSIENKRLSDEWYETTRYGKNWVKKDEHGDKEKWELYLNHQKMLEKKYLPHKLSCLISPLNIENVDEFKKGLIRSLWNCDCCSYNLKPENIKIYDNEDGYYTTIEFILDVNL